MNNREVVKMTARDTAGARLSEQLRRIPAWSDELDAIQLRILAEGIHGLLQRMIEGLQIVDVEILTFIAHEQPEIDSLPQEARIELAKMIVLSRATMSPSERQSVEELFEALIDEVIELVGRINSRMETSAWALYSALQLLEINAVAMDQVDIEATGDLIASVYRRIDSFISPDYTMLEHSAPPDGWGPGFPEEIRMQAGRLLALCVAPDNCEFSRLPRRLIQERLRTEGLRVRSFLDARETI
jgi:hypothetical protein